PLPKARFAPALILPDAPIGSDVPALLRAFAEAALDRCLVPCRSRFQSGWKDVGAERQTEVGETPRPPPVRLPIGGLGIVDAFERPSREPRRIGTEIDGAGRRRGEQQLAPALRQVHVDRALRRPHPVVLGGIEQLSIPSLAEAPLQLDAREVDAPVVA